MNSSVKRLLGALLLIATIGLSSVLAIRGADASVEVNLVHNHPILIDTVASQSHG